MGCEFLASQTSVRCHFCSKQEKFTGQYLGVHVLPTIIWREKGEVNFSDAWTREKKERCMALLALNHKNMKLVQEGDKNSSHRQYNKYYWQNTTVSVN